MVLQLLALAKLQLLASSSHGLITPLLAALICPFVLKLSSSLAIVRCTSAEALNAARLFFFQLRQIAFQVEPDGLRSGRRWERAIRLVYERLTHARRSPVLFSGEDSLHTFSMLAL